MKKEKVDPAFTYTDKKITQLKKELTDKIENVKYDLLTNEIRDLQDKVDELEKIITEQRRISYQNSIVTLELFAASWIHDNSGIHLPIPPHRLL
jgi:hypothetical protein